MRQGAALAGGGRRQGAWRGRAEPLLVGLRVAALALAGWLLGGGALWAQDTAEQRSDSAQVPIFEDNLDDARTRAVQVARNSIVRKAVEELVAPDWLALYDDEIRRRILGRLDRYIAAFRLQRSEPSLDRTRYAVTVQAQVNRPQLTEDLRELSLPIRGEPPRPIAVIYSAHDPVLALASQRTRILADLTARLALLNLAPSVVQAVAAPVAQLLAAPHANPAPRQQALRRYRSPAVLFLAFALRAPPGAPAEWVPAAEATLYQTETGEALTQIVQRARPAGGASPASVAPAPGPELAALLVEGLLNQFQPRTLPLQQLVAGGARPLKIRVSGFRNLAEEEAFERAFFRRDTPFEKFALREIGPESVTYSGTYSEERRGLEDALQRRMIEGFEVLNAFWVNNVLELDVRRRDPPRQQELKPFPAEQRQGSVAEMIDALLAAQQEPQQLDPVYAEVEDNGWHERANPIPIGAAVYGLLDSRSDVDTFVAEYLPSGETLQVQWVLLGRTNLSPALRVYDEQGALLQTHFPRSRITFSITVPKGQHGFFLEMGDRYGAMEWESGGYLNTHYLFRVDRPNAATP